MTNNFEIIPREQTPKVPALSVSIQEFLAGHTDLLNEFLEFAKTCPRAVGLAANQVSINGQRFMERVFAIRDGRYNEWRLVIDPQITFYGGIKELKEEGCLTWSGMKILAERYRKVEVSYYTMEGEFKQGKIYTGFEAQIWQHECNHLNGVEERVVDLKTISPKEIKYQRNEPCPCGSGLKYKKCCNV